MKHKKTAAFTISFFLTAVLGLALICPALSPIPGMITAMAAPIDMPEGQPFIDSGGDTPGQTAQWPAPMFSTQTGNSSCRY